MAKEPEMKSAYELAMERLRAKDKQDGVKQHKPLTLAQKEQIKQARVEAKAKIAQLEIMFKKEIAAAQGDPEKIAQINEHVQIDRRRAESAAEEAIARIRRGKS